MSKPDKIKQAKWNDLKRQLDKQHSEHRPISGDLYLNLVNAIRYGQYLEGYANEIVFEATGGKLSKLYDIKTVLDAIHNPDFGETK